MMNIRIPNARKNEGEITNPRLKQAINRLKEENSVRNRNLLVDEVIRAKFLSPVEIYPPPKLDGQDGRVTLDKDTTVSFTALLDGNKTPFLPAFTDWEELRRWQRKDNQQTVITTFDDLASMVLSDEKTSGGFVINPYGRSVVFTRDMIASIKTQKDELTKKGVLQSVGGKGETVEIGEPQNRPEKLLTVVRATLARYPVSRACLKMMKRNGELGWLIVIEHEGDKDEILSAVGKASQGSFDGLPVFLLDTGSEAGRSVISSAEPFYKKGE